MKTSRTLSPATVSRVRLVNGITATVWSKPKSMFGSRKTPLDDLVDPLDDLVDPLDDLVDTSDDLVDTPDDLVDTSDDLDDLVAHPATTRKRRRSIPR
jgi:hypothetical protein